MRRISLLVLVIILSLILVSCTSDVNDPDDPWQVDEYEFNEKFQIYVDKIYEVIDKSGKTYIFTDLTNKYSESKDHIYYHFEFEDSIILYIILRYHGSKMRGRISETLSAPYAGEKEDIDIDPSYFSMLQEINLFSVYNHFGDENTFVDLLSKAKERYIKGERPYTEFSKGDFSLGNRYEVGLYDRAEFSFSSTLSSKNLH